VAIKICVTRYNPALGLSSVGYRYQELSKWKQWLNITTSVTSEYFLSHTVLPAHSVITFRF